VIGNHNSSKKLIASSLHSELIDFEAHISSYREEQEVHCTHIYERIKKITRDLSGDLEVGIYGSYATKLSMPWSDLDLMVFSNTSKELSSIEVLQQIEIQLKVAAG
jgi:DNA polymerase sigma